MMMSVTLTAIRPNRLLFDIIRYLKLGNSQPGIVQNLWLPYTAANNRIDKRRQQNVLLAMTQH